MRAVLVVVSALFIQSAAAVPLTIREAGDYTLNKRIQIKVTTQKDTDGLTRSELHFTAQNDAGKTITDHCALSFGEGTWAVMAKEKTATRAWITIIDHDCIQTFEFEAEEKRARFSRAGIDTETRWMNLTARFLKGQLSQFPDEEVVGFARKVLPELKPVPAAARTPKLAVHLIARKGDAVQLMRPTMARHYSNPSRVGRFVRLSEEIIAGENIVATGASTGVLRTHYGAKDMTGEKFAKLIEEHKGRTAAFVKDGIVVSEFMIKPDMNLKSFEWSSIY